ncbi:hypothetical protein, partial [Shewanella algae]|uniref:hypothetical protein n=1 Tax=Shewanella algae TaxID=38313 RepID=UPI00313CF57A
DDRLRRLLRTMTVPTVIAFADQQDGLTDQQAAYLAAFVPASLRGLANLLKDPYDATVRSIYPGRIMADGQWLPGMPARLAADL